VALHRDHADHLIPAPARRMLGKVALGVLTVEELAADARRLRETSSFPQVDKSLLR